MQHCNGPIPAIFRKLFFATALFGFNATGAQAQGITVSAGAHLVMQGNATLTVQNGNFRNNGTFQAGQSTVALTGNGTQAALLQATPATTLYNVKLSRTNSGAKLLTSVSVANEVQMAGGLLELNNQQLDLGLSGTIINETEANRITGTTGGTVKRQAMLNAPALSNPGNIGVSVSSDAMMGLTTIIRSHVPQTNEAGTGHSIARTFTITPENNEGLNATLRMQFFNAELNSLPESELTQWNSSDLLHWNNNGRDSLCNEGHWVEKNSYSSFTGYYTLGSITSTPLPLQLIWFTAQEKNGAAVLDWELANNNLAVGRIDIERSATAQTNSFETIGNKTQPAGQQLKFNYVDAAPLNGTSFYRLKLTGADGSVVYSPVRQVQVKNNIAVQVYPVPATDQVSLQVPATANGQLTVSMLNMNGQQLLRQNFEMQPGINTFAINLSQVPQGVYVIKFSQPAYQDVKIMKQ